MSPRPLKKVMDALQAWGVRLFSPPAAHSRKSLSVYLPLADGTRILVGTLFAEPGEWVFDYSAAFRARVELPPIPDFPDKQRTYRSDTLWPFFETRIPPPERPDVERIIKAKKLSAQDVFSLLAELGRQTLASPYQLEAKEA